MDLNPLHERENFFLHSTESDEEEEQTYSEYSIEQEMLIEDLSEQLAKPDISSDMKSLSMAASKIDNYAYILFEFVKKSRNTDEE